MDDLLPLVYDDMHLIAARYFQRERREHTLKATALVHEAYVHFMAVASLAMRRKW